MHGGAGWFQHKGEFPNGRNAERPLAAEAERFYRSGVPFLQRYLPFWLANLFERMWPVLVTHRSRCCCRCRACCRRSTNSASARASSAGTASCARWRTQVGKKSAAELARELDALEQRVERIAVPLAYVDELYALRSHIQLVRGRLPEPAAQPLAQ